MDSSKQATIVVVDDDETMRWVLTQLLTRVAPAHTVQACASGEEVLTYLADHHVSCVITDYLMPHMSGLELATVIMKQWPQVPVVLITGGSMTNVRDEALAAGCAVVLEKPVMPMVLTEAIMPFLTTADA